MSGVAVRTSQACREGAGSERKLSSSHEEPGCPSSALGQQAAPGPWPGGQQPLQGSPPTRAIPSPRGALGGEARQPLAHSWESPTLPTQLLPTPATAQGGARLSRPWLLLAPERTCQLPRASCPHSCLHADPQQPRGPGVQAVTELTDLPAPAPQGHLEARKGRSGAARWEPQGQGLGSTRQRAAPSPWQQPLGPGLAGGGGSDRGSGK